MPLSTRRRRNPVRAARRQMAKPSAYPAGESALEHLPLEILTSIFIESQNLNFVRTSKTIFASLGQSPSDWLILEFFGHNWNEDSQRSALVRAINVRGFTLQLYESWLDKYGVPPTDFRDFPPYLKKRWLCPKNEELLRTLLNYGEVRLAPSPWPDKTVVTYIEGYNFYSDPRVTRHWAREMLYHGYCSEFGGNEWKAECCRDLLFAAFRKPNIDVFSLNLLFDHFKFAKTEGTRAEISWAAFESENFIITIWAFHRGFVPTADQLQRVFLPTNDQFNSRASQVLRQVLRAFWVEKFGEIR